ncbi:MAG: hypothetical protein ACO1N9_06645 [Flavobacterium sp.]
MAEQFKHKGFKITSEEKPFTFRLGSKTHSVPLFAAKTVFTSHDDFRFEVYETNLLNKIGKLFGMQDIKTGIPDFDKKFIIKSNNEIKIKELLNDSVVRNVIGNIKGITVEITNQDGVDGGILPKNKLALSIFTESSNRDKVSDENVCLLFTRILDHLLENRSISL